MKKRQKENLHGSLHIGRGRPAPKGFPALGTREDLL